MLGNKNRIPLIVVMPPENDAIMRMSLMKALEENEFTPIIHVGNEAEHKEEYKLFEESSEINGNTINKLALLTAMTTLTLDLAKKQNKVTIIDGVEYSEVLLFPIKNYSLHAEPSLIEDFDFENKDFNSPQLSTPKKNRKQNNRKVKKRKKAKNGK